MRQRAASSFRLGRSHHGEFQHERQPRHHAISFRSPPSWYRNATPLSFPARATMMGRAGAVVVADRPGCAGRRPPNAAARSSAKCGATRSLLSRARTACSAAHAGFLARQVGAARREMLKFSDERLKVRAAQPACEPGHVYHGPPARASACACVAQSLFPRSRCCCTRIA